VVKVVISTDAHATGNLGYIRFGVAQARRGWLTRMTWSTPAALTNSSDC
jgi:histidinol phosphatase-like PHP family hydrolase